MPVSAASATASPAPGQRHAQATLQALCRARRKPRVVMVALLLGVACVAFISMLRIMSLDKAPKSGSLLRSRLAETADGPTTSVMGHSDVDTEPEMPPGMLLADDPPAVRKPQRVSKPGSNSRRRQQQVKKQQRRQQQQQHQKRVQLPQGLPYLQSGPVPPGGRRWKPCHDSRPGIDEVSDWSYKRLLQQLGANEGAMGGFTRVNRATDEWASDLPMEMPPPPPPLCKAYLMAHSAVAAEYWRPRVHDLLDELVIGYSELLGDKPSSRYRKLGEDERPLLNRNCWEDNEAKEKDERMLCLPEFSLLGFAKCGTSHFEGTLQKTFNSAMVQKERRLFELTALRQYEDLGRILHAFKPEMKRLMKRPARELEEWHSNWFGDLTTVFLSHLAWSTWPDKKVAVKSPLRDRYSSMPRGMWWDAMLPDQKYLIMLRDPVDLIYSRFRHFNIRPGARQDPHSRGWGELLKSVGIVKTWDGDIADVSHVPQLFHRYVMDEIKLFNRCVRGDGAHQQPPRPRHWNHWDCVGAGDVKTLGVVRQDAMASWDILVGVYVYWLGWWMDVVGARERTLVIRMEDFVEDPEAQMRRFVDHVGVPQPDQVIVPDVVRNENVWVPKKEVPMLPKTRKLLQEFYKPYNMLLAELLGNDDFNYKYGEEAEEEGDDDAADDDDDDNE